MTVDPLDRQLLHAIQGGLPIAARPYAELGRQLDLPEQEVIERLAKMQQAGLIKRLGLIVKHRKLGYQANAMVVWDIPDEQVQAVGVQMSRMEFVNLCYRRPRHGAEWPFNLFCMIHGKSRETVLAQLQTLIQTCELQAYRHEVLFSRRCFKQRGARYRLNNPLTAHG